MSIESMKPSNHLILCHPLLLHSIFPSIRVFSSESALHIRWPKYWGFGFSMNPSNEYSGLVSFRIDLFHLLAVQITLKDISLCHGFCVLEEDDRKGMTNPPESICKYFLPTSSKGIWENHRKDNSIMYHSDLREQSPVGGRTDVSNLSRDLRISALFSRADHWLKYQQRTTCTKQFLRVW